MLQCYNSQTHERRPVITINSAKRVHILIKVISYSNKSYSITQQQQQLPSDYLSGKCQKMVRVHHWQHIAKTDMIRPKPKGSQDMGKTSVSDLVCTIIPCKMRYVFIRLVIGSAEATCPRVSTSFSAFDFHCDVHSPFAGIHLHISLYRRQSITFSNNWLNA